jgi:apolipoprotein N-acyltransferase
VAGLRATEINVSFFVSHSQSSISRRWCALLTAFLWWVATLQSGFFAFGWIALVPLFWSLHNLSPRARFRQGWFCGFCSFALLNWWVALAITRGSHMIGVPSVFGAGLGVIAVCLIALVHGLTVAVVAWTWDSSSTRWRQWPLLWPIFVALIWTLLDFVRCSTPLAHSWGALAYTQWRDTALLQSAAVAGQHGLTFLCAWFASQCCASGCDTLRRASRDAPVLGSCACLCDSARVGQLATGAR